MIPDSLIVMTVTVILVAITSVLQYKRRKYK